MKSTRLYNQIMSRVDRGLKQALYESKGPNPLADLYNEIMKSAPEKKSSVIGFFNEDKPNAFKKKYPKIYEEMKTQYMKVYNDEGKKDGKSFGCVRVLAAYAFAAFIDFLNKYEGGNVSLQVKARQFYNADLNQQGLSRIIITYGIKSEQVNLPKFMRFLQDSFETISGIRIKDIKF